MLARAALLVAALTTPAAAQVATDPASGPAAAAGAAAVPVPSAAGPTVKPPREGHKGQFQLSLRTGVGMRAIVPYGNTEYCGDLDSETSSGFAPVCTGRAPFSIDLELGYGVTPKIDTILEMRIGLESDFGATPGVGSGPRMFHLAPGARFFFSDSKSSKLFTTAQLVLDFAGYEDAAGEGRGVDIGVRNMNGVWFDLKPNYGFYVYVGETLTLARWLRFELEGGIGFSYRYP